jgi:uncharacterized FlaG/YvyC family protein
MKFAMDVLMPLTIISLGSCLLFVSCSGARSSGKSSGAAPAPASRQPSAQSNVEKQRQNAEQQARPEVEQQRKEAQEQTEKTLDKEAIEAINQTQKAINAIAANKTDEALSAIEQATGKINILLARNPATALIPVSVEVDVIDAAPHDIQAIRDVAKDASRAVDDKNFPTARVLLYSLMSEIRVRTYNVPLATYPTALTDAARMLDKKKTGDANNILLTALNTLAVIDRATPLPLILAREAVDTAQAQSQKDKASAQTLLETAKKEVERSKELGYAGKDQEYAALNTDINNLEKQLKGNGDVGAVFAKLKDRLGAFLKRQSSEQKSS